MTDVPVALVTGGAGGIGAATARRLLDQAHRVAITGRDHDRLGRLAQELGEAAGLLLLAGDAADYTAVHTAVETTSTSSGGWTPSSPMPELPPTTPWPTATPTDGARWS
jgi:NADP-dependent 3-hydroxy acid dehydrogenase YdfG